MLHERVISTFVSPGAISIMRVATWLSYPARSGRRDAKSGVGRASVGDEAVHQMSRKQIKADLRLKASLLCRHGWDLSPTRPAWLNGSRRRGEARRLQCADAGCVGCVRIGEERD